MRTRETERNRDRYKVRVVHRILDNSCLCDFLLFLLLLIVFISLLAITNSIFFITAAVATAFGHRLLPLDKRRLYIICIMMMCKLTQLSDNTYKYSYCDD